MKPHPHMVESLRCCSSFDFDGDTGSGTAVGIDPEAEVPNCECDQDDSNDPGNQRTSAALPGVDDNWPI